MLNDCGDTHCKAAHLFILHSASARCAYDI